MPRVLIVTSMFLPHLAADVHRARILARELPKLGWDVEVLVPGDEFHSAESIEPHAELLQVSASVHRCRPEWAALFRLLRSQSLSWRAYRPVKRAGDRLLASGKFDVIYISCSQANFFYLGVGWRKRFGVPFVIDMQDPWYVPDLGRPKHLGYWKRWVSNEIARILEGSTLAAAAGLVSVSPDYLRSLNGRYAGRHWSCLEPKNQAAIPFGASGDDFRAAERLPTLGCAEEKGARRTVIYTGAGGYLMERAFREFCRRLVAIREKKPSNLAGLRICLFGTEPRSGTALPVLSRIAHEAGLADFVRESPERISYIEALRRVLDADGLLVLGVEDSAYSPSKLLLYALSGKPLLACMKEGSTIDTYFDEIPELGHIVHFSATASAPLGGTLEVETFLGQVSARVTVDRGSALRPYLAEVMARRHVELFESCTRPA